jgi:ABC-type branched-subunit amino acid transport system permease subunit
MTRERLEALAMSAMLAGLGGYLYVTALLMLLP